MSEGKIGESEHGIHLKKWSFWRNQAVYFCCCSVIGHWVEIAYCTFMRLFGIYDPESLVWDDPFYPFIVYGVAVVVCAIVLVPLKNLLVRSVNSWALAVCLCFACSTVVCLLMELGMGFLLNQPDVFGIYPLWDNSDLPLNILSQAWLVNDLFLGAAATFYIWLLYPLFQAGMAKPPSRWANALAAIVVVSFTILCVAKFL